MHLGKLLFYSDHKLQQPNEEGMKWSRRTKLPYMKGNSCGEGEVEERVNPEMIKESVKFCTKPFFTSIITENVLMYNLIFIV